MAGPEILLQNEDHWQTRMGAAMLQERVVFRGKDLHRDLGHWSWLELYLYGITGRTFDDVELKILNAIWVFTSYPDPRIWNNRVAGLCGTARSTGALSLSAASAVSDAEIYGGQPLIKALHFLKNTWESIQRGKSLGELVNAELRINRRVPGFGRPKAKEDERIEPMLGFMESTGYKTGKYLELAFNIEKYLIESRRRFRINYAALVASICADMGFSAKEFYLYMIPVFTAGFAPCYIDALGQSEGALFPLRCKRIDYSGPEKRCWDEFLD